MERVISHDADDIEGLLDCRVKAPLHQFANPGVQVTGGLKFVYELLNCEPEQACGPAGRLGSDDGGLAIVCSNGIRHLGV